MIYAGYKNIKSAKVETSDAEKKEPLIREEISLMEKAVVTSEAASSVEKVVLARWQYPVKSWQAFQKLEKKERKYSMWIEIILIILLGAFIIKTSKNESWLVGFAISTPIAFIIAFLRFRMNLSSISLSGTKDAEVIITNEAVLVNGKYNRFVGYNLWLGNVAIKKFKGTDVLEITYRWNTRSGNISEELRIPIPEGKMGEAEAVKTTLLSSSNQP